MIREFKRRLRVNLLRDSKQPSKIKGLIFIALFIYILPIGGWLAFAIYNQ